MIGRFVLEVYKENSGYRQFKQKSGVEFIRLLFILTIISFFTIQTTYGQNVETPVDIQEAVIYLQKESSECIKQSIKQTPDDRLIKWSFPDSDDFKIIYKWINKENRESKIRDYLIKKGISDFEHQHIIILIAFKKTLLGEKYNEDDIIAPYKFLEDEWRAEDKIRYMTDILRGVYIPKDLEDCFKQIDRFWSKETKEKAKNLSEEEFTAVSHLGFGMWIRNNWQLWNGSRLSLYFNDMGIYHPDDMSDIILTSYHRYLNGKEIKLEEQIRFYQEYWEKIKKQGYMFDKSPKKAKEKSQK